MMNPIARRTFLKNTAIKGGAALLFSWLPASVWAKWPESAFKADKLEQVLNELYATADLTNADDKIKIKAPDIAENGRVVPVTVETEGLSDLKSIAIFAEKNPLPLVAKFNLGEGSAGFVKTRIKMSETSPVRVVVETGNGLYTSAREVKVTIGGCGG